IFYKNKIKMISSISMRSIQRTIFAVFGIYFYYLTLKNVRYLEGVAIHLLTPLAGLIFAKILLKERLKFSQYLGILLGIAGVFLMISDEFFQLQNHKLSVDIKWLFPCVAVLCLTFSKLLTSKLAKAGYNPIYLVWQLMWGIFIGMLPLAYQDFIWPNAMQWAILFALSLGNFLAHYAYAYAYKFSNVSLLTPVSLLKLILGTLGSYLFLGELPSNPTVFIVGGGMLVTSIFLSMRKFQ
ncbi:MAG: DMT family transporter, partial [Gammaproteobacteria bacterium]